MDLCREAAVLEKCPLLDLSSLPPDSKQALTGYIISAVDSARKKCQTGGGWLSVYVPINGQEMPLLIPLREIENQQSFDHTMTAYTSAVNGLAEARAPKKPKEKYRKNMASGNTKHPESCFRSRRHRFTWCQIKHPSVVIR